MSGTNLAQRLRQALDTSDKKLKFYGFEGAAESVSFSEFQHLVGLTAHRLRECGAGPNVVVALLGPTGLELCRAAAAVWSLGATLTVLPTPSRLAGLEQFFQETLAKLVRSQAGLLLGEASMVEPFAELAAVPALSWEQLEEGSTGKLSLVTIEREAALIQFSSGTTREPQPVLLSQAALLANADAVLAKFPGRLSDHSCVSWLPLYHDMGLLGCFLMPLLASVNLTLMGPEVFAARPVTWLEAISAEKATTSSAPNFALAYCADRISDEQMAQLDLSCWRVAMVGAEAVRPATLRRFAERFAPVGFLAQAFSPVYGLAEATLAVTFSPLGEGLKTLPFDSQVLANDGTVVTGECESPSLGTPLEGVEVAIRDDDGKPLGEDRLGEVYVRGPSLFSGYLDGDASSKLTSDGWLRTGDMGFLHEGELHLYGRRRDILLLDGRNHDPNLLEGAVESLTPLRRCCAFIQEGDERDLLVLVCEVSHDHDGERQALEREILAAARRQSGLLPSRLVLVQAGTLPHTSSGKLQRGETARLHAAEALQLWQPRAAAR